MRLTEEPEVVQGDHTRASFLVAIPSLGMVPIEFCVALARLQMPVNCKSSSMVVTKTEVGLAREYVAEHVLSMKDRPEYILFLGDDMLPPWDGVVKLYQEMKTGKWDVLAGLYFIKQDLPVPIIWRDNIEGWLEPYIHYQPGEVVDVDVCGMDFTMIRPEIFSKMSKPWFKTGPTEFNKGNIVYHTEDVWFCHYAKKAGARIGVHTDVRVGHLLSSTGEVY